MRSPVEVLFYALGASALVGLVCMVAWDLGQRWRKR